MSQSLADRVNTEPLRRLGVPTVALVVTNPGTADVPPCRAQFVAAFPVRDTMPVTVRDFRGVVTASRLVQDDRDFAASGLSPGAFLWTITLEFVLPHGIAGRTGQAFSASYEAVPSPNTDWDALPLRDDLPVVETGLHGGDLPLVFSLCE